MSEFKRASDIPLSPDSPVRGRRGSGAVIGGSGGVTRGRKRPAELQDPAAETSARKRPRLELKEAPAASPAKKPPTRSSRGTTESLKRTLASPSGKEVKRSEETVTALDGIKEGLLVTVVGLVQQLEPSGSIITKDGRDLLIAHAWVGDRSKAFVQLTLFAEQTGIVDGWAVGDFLLLRDVRVHSFRERLQLKCTSSSSMRVLIPKSDLALCAREDWDAVLASLGRARASDSNGSSSHGGILSSICSGCRSAASAGAPSAGAAAVAGRTSGPRSARPCACGLLAGLTSIPPALRPALADVLDFARSPEGGLLHVFLAASGAGAGSGSGSGSGLGAESASADHPCVVHTRLDSLTHGASVHVLAKLLDVATDSDPSDSSASKSRTKAPAPAKRRVVLTLADAPGSLSAVQLSLSEDSAALVDDLGLAALGRLQSGAGAGSVSAAALTSRVLECRHVLAQLDAETGAWTLQSTAKTALRLLPRHCPQASAVLQRASARQSASSALAAASTKGTSAMPAVSGSDSSNSGTEAKSVSLRSVLTMDSPASVSVIASIAAFSFPSEGAQPAVRFSGASSEYSLLPPAQRLVYCGCSRCARPLLPDSNRVYFCPRCPAIDKELASSEPALGYFWADFFIDLVDSDAGQDLEGETKQLAGVRVSHAAAASLLHPLSAADVATATGSQSQSGLSGSPSGSPAERKGQSALQLQSATGAVEDAPALAVVTRRLQALLVADPRLGMRVRGVFELQLRVQRDELGQPVRRSAQLVAVQWQWAGPGTQPQQRQQEAATRPAAGAGAGAAAASPPRRPLSVSGQQAKAAAADADADSQASLEL